MSKMSELDQMAQDFCEKSDEMRETLERIKGPIYASSIVRAAHALGHLGQMKSITGEGLDEESVKIIGTIFADIERAVIYLAAIASSTAEVPSIQMGDAFSQDLFSFIKLQKQLARDANKLLKGGEE